MNRDAEWEQAVEHHKRAVVHIDRAIAEIWLAEGMPMCCAENARLELLEAKASLKERIKEFKARLKAERR